MYETIGTLKAVLGLWDILTKKELDFQGPLDSGSIWKTILTRGFDVFRNFLRLSTIWWIETSTLCILSVRIWAHLSEYPIVWSLNYVHLLVMENLFVINIWKWSNLSAKTTWEQSSNLFARNFGFYKLNLLPTDHLDSSHGQAQAVMTRRAYQMIAWLFLINKLLR